MELVLPADGRAALADSPAGPQAALLVPEGLLFYI
jgi:hypothetical protein